MNAGFQQLGCRRLRGFGLWGARPTHSSLPLHMTAGEPALSRRRNTNDELDVSAVRWTLTEFHNVSAYRYGSPW